MDGSGRSARAALLLLAFAFAFACSSARGIYHVVQRGENLFRIGKAYGVPYRRLAAVNGIRDPARIEAGRKIFVPGANRRLPVEIITPIRAQTGRAPLGELPRGARVLRWPTLEGVVSSRFGPRSGTFHDGIDIAAPQGTRVYAARAGRVIYSDEIPGYGNIVIVDHGHGLSTVYAHNSRNEVSAGDEVEDGGLVSRVGRTGRTTGANLHFEVRQQNVARNPLDYLPPIETSSAR